MTPIKPEDMKRPVVVSDFVHQGEHLHQIEARLRSIELTLQSIGAILILMGIGLLILLFR